MNVNLLKLRRSKVHKWKPVNLDTILDYECKKADKLRKSISKFKQSEE